MLLSISRFLYEERKMSLLNLEGLIKILSILQAVSLRGCPYFGMQVCRALKPFREMSPWSWSEAVHTELAHGGRCRVGSLSV